uniref:Fatty acyl-CoA reductase n=1 Tax=Dendroctonus ponderosae TaxID=77166 RepID=A0AAR5Q6I7_DENPD
MADASVPIPQYFGGKNVFITGGSGFIGKVLIEKLLRSCPDPADRRQLLDDVDVIYHAAASVRFDDSLKSAILLNVRGTREVGVLAHEMRHLEVFVHVSTTYSHTDRRVIEEKTYRADTDWRRAIEVAEQSEEHVLRILTPHYIGPFPNTYTFTKRLAEDAVSDLCQGRIAGCIFRPSIVISTASDPFPGWIDNFNGPVGIFVASGKGILRSMYTNPDLESDYIPVDLVVKGLILATWAKASEKRESERLNVAVFNASNNSVQPMSNRELVKIGKRIAWEVPLDSMLWYPTGHVTSCYPDHFLRVVFYHLLPALLVDGLLKLTGHKPLLWKIQRKIYIANMALQYFIMQEWKFVNEKTRALQERLSPADVQAFGYGETRIDPYEFFRNAALGGRQYLLKEGGDIERARANSRRMYALSLAFDGLWYAAALYLLAFKLDTVAALRRALEALCAYFTRV